MEHMCWGSWPLRGLSEELQSGSRGRDETPGHRRAAGPRRSRHRCRAMMVVRFSFRNPELLPSLCVAISGVLWGLFWLPLRAFEDHGFKGAWPGLVIYCVCLVLLLPFLPRRWHRIRPKVATIVVTGFFTGTAFALYAISLMMTDVVRTLLLF